MSIEQFYMSLPHDISGSRTKNRFRLELLWGVGKILDLLDAENQEDFTVVFDYACDIEVHISSGFEFYQIKTHNNSTSYTAQNLTAIDGENSILGKLYILHSNNATIKTKLAIVSNAPFSDNRHIITTRETCLNSLTKDTKDKLANSLKTELALSNIDLSQLNFIYTNFDFTNPENEILGKICISFEKLMNCEPKNPNALYRLIFNTVSDKACYEYTCAEYDALISNKGITKEDFIRILEIHADSSKTGVSQTEQYLENLPNIQERRSLKIAFPKVLQGLCTSKVFKTIELEIGNFLKSNPLATDVLSTTTLLSQKFDDRFPMEVSADEKTVFYLITIHKYIEGVYD